jgi:hypothetical protein
MQSVPSETDKTTMTENPEILRIEEITRRLERLNLEVQQLLSRLPLSHHREVARLNQLVNEQTRLADTLPRRALPPRISIFFDNARDKAGFLRQRYNEALMNGELRKPGSEV